MPTSVRRNLRVTKRSPIPSVEAYERYANTAKNGEEDDAS